MDNLKSELYVLLKSFPKGNEYYTKDGVINITQPDNHKKVKERYTSNLQSVLLLGDCMHEACRRIAHRYGDYLKSDILQVTHHGLIGGDKELYELIDPEICFWPINKEVFLGLTSNQRYQWCLGEGGCDYNKYLRDESIRIRQHYHFGDTISIEIS